MAKAFAYYNEIDPYAAQWLRNLIRRGLIADGEVDERSIEDVLPGDLSGFAQCHFFAGIGVWSLALRRAGWPDDRPVWTGSCPCQPFSAAGKGDGFADERHLWPAFFHLIEQCRPRVVFGEQVASKHGLAWLDLVQADLEGAGYASAAVDICAAGVGAPHIRQRLWWVAERLGHHHHHQRLEGHAGHGDGAPGRAIPVGPAAAAGGAGGMDDTASTRHQRALQGPEGDPRYEARLRLLGEGRRSGGLADAQRERYDRGRSDGAAQGAQSGRNDAARYSDCPSGMADPLDRQLPQPLRQPQARNGDGSDRPDIARGSGRPGPTNGFWRDADWLFCRDGKWRPVEPGTFPLAHGAPARVGRLRAYGNAIVAPVAQIFIEAYLGVEILDAEAAETGKIANEEYA